MVGIDFFILKEFRWKFSTSEGLHLKYPMNFIKDSIVMFQNWNCIRVNLDLYCNFSIMKENWSMLVVIHYIYCWWNNIWWEVSTFFANNNKDTCISCRWENYINLSEISINVTIQTKIKGMDWKSQSETFTSSSKRQTIQNTIKLDRILILELVLEFIYRRPVKLPSDLPVLMNY